MMRNLRVWFCIAMLFGTGILLTLYLNTQTERATYAALMDIAMEDATKQYASGGFESAFADLPLIIFYSQLARKPLPEAFDDLTAKIMAALDPLPQEASRPPAIHQVVDATIRFLERSLDAKSTSVIDTALNNARSYSARADGYGKARIDAIETRLRKMRK